MASEWFKRQIVGQIVPAKMSLVYHMWHSWRTDPVKHTKHAGEGKWVCGFLLPPFQRDPIWNIEDKIRFIDSARRCIPIGEYTVNDTIHTPESHRHDFNGREWYFGDRWLLDGQQRLTALQEWFEDEYQVDGMYWSDLNSEDRNGFLYTVNFPYRETNFTTIEAAAEYYDLSNFGGAAHSEKDRAIFKI